MISVLLLSACANRGVGPQGGPKDTIPPAVVKEVPVSGSLNVQPKKLEITFDERPQQTEEPASQQQSPMPGEGSYDEWFDYFRRYFGG